uniref:PDZ domain-containing protein n=1 Tax=Meloidogyne hapla TaxID=6305 RepID=A0A1I8C189_MELHA
MNCHSNIKALKQCVMSSHTRLRAHTRELRSLNAQSNSTQGLVFGWLSSLTTNEREGRYQEYTIKSSQDINEATHFPWTGPRNFRIRFRRDSFYRILVFKVSRIRRKPNRLAIILHARWRQDISVGLIVASEVTIKKSFCHNKRQFQGESVQIVQVVQSSLASHHFRPGDVITDVNGERVTDTEEAVKLIRQSIAETNNFKLKIVRDISPLKRIADPAEDARSILLRNAGFWRKQCLLSSIEEEEGEVKPQKVSVYFVPKVESVPFPVDETGNELIATPSRPGGTLRERSSEDEDEEELIFPEEEDDF